MRQGLTTERRFFNNYIFLGVIFGTLAAQVIIVEFGGRAFQTTGLSITQWAVCLVGRDCRTFIHCQIRPLA